MIIIGEKLNSSIPSAKAAFEKGGDALLNLIQSQAEAGADYLDINTAMISDRERELLIDTAKKVLVNTDKGIMLDSADMSIIRDALLAVKGRDVIINSISLTKDISPLTGLDLSSVGVVAMPTDDDGIPDTAKKRLLNIRTLVNRLLQLGFKEENIYADILIETLAVNQQAALTALDTLKLVKAEIPEIKSICGASNISYGLPKRKNINTAFLSLAIYNGVDAIITDILNPDIRSAILATELLLGQDEYCMNYIDAMRE